MSKSWIERTWKNEGESRDRPQPLNRLQRIARESQEQEEAQIEGWLKTADDFIQSEPETPATNTDAEPEIA